MSLAYKKNDLFSPGPITRLNACVGKNGGPYDFRDYAQGYFLAARKLLDAVRKDPAYVDTLIYPLAFLFRHAIELSLKGLARDLGRALGQGKDPKLTHKLADNWTVVQELLKRRIQDFDPENKIIPMIDKVLRDYLEFDPVGEVFRFPEDKVGNLFLQEARLINVDVFGSVLEEIGEVFYNWFMRASELAELRQDETYDG